MKYSSLSQQGMTLIETLVAVFIFSISLVSLMVISARGIQSISVASQRATSQFLAQEGVEIIEAIRDDNFINTNISAWTENLDQCFNTPCFLSAYDFQPNPTSAYPAPCGGQCPALMVDKMLGYQYTQGDRTPFVRSIIINGDPVDPFIHVVSTVEWERANVPYSVSVEKYMTNWFQANPSL